MSVRISFFCFLCCLCAMFCGVSLGKAEEFQPAFKTLGLWDATANVRVDINVWYPTLQRPTLSHYGPWTLDVVRYGRSASGRFPLIILSHASGGSRFSYHETAAVLTQSGFVVIAPEHRHDSMYSIPYMFDMRQLTERVSQLRFIVNAALTHKDLQSFIDPNRVGIMGFGAGATAALLLGGAVPYADGWKNYCSLAGAYSPYCSPWARGRMQKMVQTLPLPEALTVTFAEPSVKAIAAVAPLYDMFFNQQSLQTLVPSLLLVNVQNNIMGKSYLQEYLPARASAVTVPYVDAADLMSPWPPSLQKDLPNTQIIASSDEQATAQESFHKYIIRFFIETLGNVQ